ncbi:THO complex subunit 5 homolog [Daphnia pulicaria]|uniref:THO complex subunit 5 homolog n=1 Tax=Daphnia pulicaria TaxID=35523 RepID=UPI001EEAA23F|nr:THO complex subunit 5 homolog [Daphnia pulicaria]
MSKPSKTKRSDSESIKQDPKKSKNDVSSMAAASKVKEFCKNFMDIEDKEVESRTGESDLKIFKETCCELKRLMTDILQLKTSGKTDEETSKKIIEKRIEASLLFVTLKKLNRIDKLRLKKARDTTHDAKQRVDTFHLQLENLLYEVFHLKKEVDKCLEFKSKDEDIELVPVEEFYQEAPSSISKMELTKSNQHKLTLARLEWEFEQRKRLSEQCRSLEQNREKASSEISQKQKQLESLLPRLTSILESTRPLQEELNLPVERIKFQKELAVLLPDPLYILYSQIKAFIEACDPSLQISIEGGMEDAINFGSKNKTGLDEILEDVDSAESDMETEYETNKRSATSNKMKTDWQLTRHPLRIQLKIERVVLNFTYLTTLNIVTVDCKPVQQDDGVNQICMIDNLLSGLFPNDHGDESPSWVNCFQARSMINGKITEQGKSYLWAQRLAGLDFNGIVKSTPQSFINTEFVETVILALKSRITYRFQFVKVLHLLEKGELDLNQDSNATFPPTIYSRLVSWTSSTYEECLVTSKNLERLLNFLEVNPKSLSFYKATLERESAKLLAMFMVPVDYPNSTPICSLELNWNGKHNRENSEIIRRIEAEVNVPSTELPPQHKVDLLTVQLKKLSLHLDLITEIDGQLMKKGGGSWQSQSKPEFAAEKMIPQLIKGHDRAYPTKYDTGSGFFLHH